MGDGQSRVNTAMLFQTIVPLARAMLESIYEALEAGTVSSHNGDHEDPLVSAAWSWQS